MKSIIGTAVSFFFLCTGCSAGLNTNDSGSLYITAVIGNPSGSDPDGGSPTSLPIQSLAWSLSIGTTIYDNGTVKSNITPGYGGESVSFLTSNVPVDSIYSLTVSGSNSDGQMCAGTATGLAVQAGLVSDVILHVACEIQ
jgi:hypothetical protein